MIKLVNKMSEHEKRIVRRSMRKRKQIEREKRKMTAPVIGEFTNPPKPTGLFPIRLRESSERKQAGRMKVRRECSKSYRQIEKLKQKLSSKAKLAERYRKSLYRHKIKNLNTNSPRTKTRMMLTGQK